MNLSTYALTIAPPLPYLVSIFPLSFHPPRPLPPPVARTPVCPPRPPQAMMPRIVTLALTLLLLSSGSVRWGGEECSPAATATAFVVPGGTRHQQQRRYRSGPLPRAAEGGDGGGTSSTTTDNRSSISSIPGPPYSGPSSKPILDSISSPDDMKGLNLPELKQVRFCFFVFLFSCFLPPFFLFLRSVVLLSLAGQQPLRRFVFALQVVQSFSRQPFLFLISLPF